MSASKYTETLEFDVKDAFAALKKLRRLQSVYRAYMITCTRVSVKYDNRKITAKELFKIVRQNSNSDQKEAA